MKHYLQKLWIKPFLLVGFVTFFFAALTLFLAVANPVPPENLLTKLTGTLSDLTLERPNGFLAELSNNITIIAVTLKQSNGQTTRFNTQIKWSKKKPKLAIGMKTKLAYFTYGINSRAKKIADLKIGAATLVNYQDFLTKDKTEKAEKFRSALVWIIGAFIFIVLSILAWKNTKKTKEASQTSRGFSIGLASWLLFTLIPTSIVFEKPDLLYPKYGEFFLGIPIEFFIVPAVLVIMFPLLIGLLGWGELMMLSQDNGRGTGNFGMLVQWVESITSSDKTERNTCLKALSLPLYAGFLIFGLL